MSLVVCLVWFLCASCSGRVGAPDGLVGTAPAGSKNSGSRNILWYRLEPAGDFLDVRLRLLGPPERTRLFLPAEWAGRDDYADSLRIGAATAPDGPREVLIDRNGGFVDVDSADADWIELAYRVELGAGSKFHAQRDGSGVVAFGQTFLVTPARQIVERSQSIPVEVHAPVGWPVVATWKKLGERGSVADPSRTVHGFVAADVGALRDAFVVTGPKLELFQPKTSGEVTVAFSPEFSGNSSDLGQNVSRIVAEYERRFGSAGAVAVYVRTVDSGGRLSGTGRRGGFVVELPKGVADMQEVRLLVAHEALHLWNGHTLVPRPEAEAATRWFKEGVTHYVALQTAASLRMVDEKFALAELARIASNYLKNPLAGGTSGSAIDVRRFPYDFGALLALAIDRALLVDTQGEERVGSWLALAIRRADRAGYDGSTLLKVLQDVTDRPLPATETVWRQHVRAGEPIDVRGLFAAVGLHWLPETTSSPGRLSPLDGSAPTYRAILGLPPHGGASD